MTQREGPTSGGVVKAAPRPVAASALPISPTARAEGSAPPSWEELYRTLPPAQQHELLELARRQGILYAHQLPAARNGVPFDPARAILSKLLAGKVDELPRLTVGPVDWVDTALDSHQRDAVARALHTPDVFLLQGLPGTGKSRVAAEILTQATARGERVLFLATTSAALDRVLETVRTRECVCASRCLDRGEHVETLAPTIRPLLYTEQVRALREETLGGAGKLVQTQEARLARLRRDETLGPRFEELARRSEELARQRADLHRAREAVPETVRREADEETATGPFARALRTWTQARADEEKRFAARAEEVQRDLDTRRAELEELTRQHESLQPLVEAKEHKKVWSLRFWQAVVGGVNQARWQDIESHLQAVQDGLTTLERALADNAQARADAGSHGQAERERLLLTEVRRRQNGLVDQAAALGQEQTQLESKWQALCGELGPDSPAPDRMALEAVDQARTAWGEALAQLTAQAAFGRRWADQLAHAPDALVERLPQCVNLVAATTAAVPNEPPFGPGTHYDLLLLEGADQVTEAEFQQLARRARRWVLLAETPLEPVALAPVERGGKTGASRGPADQRRAGHTASSAHLPAPASIFQRLWQHLHLDPSHLPYAWLQENNRLVCRLRVVPPPQRKLLEIEHLADAPDVELRILSENGNPSLVEIAFPPAITLAEAKRFIYHELQELPLRASGPGLHWVEEPQCLVLHLCERSAGDCVPVSLEDGVRELVSQTAANGEVSHDPGYTYTLEFDRRAGWHRQRAEDWLALHAGLRDPGRTARLLVSHRLRPELARFVADLVCLPADYQFGPDDAPRTDGGNVPPSVEFIAVPPLTRDRGQRGRDRGRGPDTAELLARMRGGAGLELELDDPRHRDRIPTEVRAALPARGLVNYLEAQAVVKVLKELAASRETARLLGSDPVIAVLALYHAQAVLVRHLIDQTPELAGAPFRIEVDTPAGYRQREAPLVLLSLTRSHSHRAVPFGEGPHALALALTRARAKVIILGDPGTLVRRTQWEGTLDHLDAAAATRERDLLDHLVRYLQGQGPHPRVFHLREGYTA